MRRMPQASRSARVSGLRGVAALSVVIHHVLLQATNHHWAFFGPASLDALVLANMNRLGGWGVSIFLVLSGWGLARSCENSTALPAYALRRALRLYPMFWWVAVPTVLLALLVGVFHADQLWKLPLWLVGVNFLSPQLASPLPGVAPQWWYVGLALQTYIVFPLLWVVVRRAGLGVLIVSALVINAVSVIVIAHLPAAWEYLNMQFVGARLLEVVSGVVLFAIHRTRAGPRSRGRTAATWGALLGGFILLAFAQPSERVHWLFEISVVVLVALVLWVPVRSTGRASWIRTAADWMGQVSYPLYLCHYGLIALVLAGLEGLHAPSLVLLLVFGISTSLVVAAGFHYSFSWAGRRIGARGHTGMRRS